MGQRTQILVQTIDRNGNEKNRMYHSQWGIGRVMFLQIIDLFITDYFGDKVRNENDFTNLVLTKKVIDITSEFDNNLNCHIPINNLEVIKELFDQCDNNDGGLVIQVIEGQTMPYYTESFKIGFLLPDFKKYVTPLVYANKKGGEYTCNNFKRMFKAFIAAFDIEVMVS